MLKLRNLVFLIILKVSRFVSIQNCIAWMSKTWIDGVGVPEPSALGSMSESERNALGATLKDRGNKLYSKKDFRKAVDWYVSLFIKLACSFLL